jgi:hypothetical protein
MPAKTMRTSGRFFSFCFQYNRSDGPCHARAPRKQWVSMPSGKCAELIRRVASVLALVRAWRLRRVVALDVTGGSPYALI